MPIEDIIAIIEALAQFAPKIPALMAGIETAIKNLENGTSPTPEEKASIDALLDAAHEAFQNAVPAAAAPAVAQPTVVVPGGAATPAAPTPEPAPSAPEEVPPPTE